MDKVESIIRKMCDALGVDNKRQLALKLGINQSVINGWKDRNNVPFKYLQDISLKMNISVESLLTLENEIKLTLNDGLSSENFKLELLPKAEKSTLRKIPYYDCFEASAGFGAINGDVRAPEHIHLPEWFLKGASSSTEAIKCRGDSMSPSINSGDIMFIDREDIEIKDGEVYVVRCAEELFVKRLFKLPGKIMARSDNAGAGYGEFSVNLKESEILGRVIYRMERV